MRDQEAAHADADDLRHELELYKSVAVPPSAKSRTGMTRVGRIPLVNQSLNGKPSGSAAAMTKIVGAGVKRLDHVDEQEYLPGDLTVDELQ